jgi:hypothetical protein
MLATSLGHSGAWSQFLANAGPRLLRPVPDMVGLLEQKPPRPLRMASALGGASQPPAAGMHVSFVEGPASCRRSAC